MYFSRYTPTGTLDNTFGDGGLVTTDITTAVGYAPDTPTAGGLGQLTIDPSGRIVIGGSLAPISIVNGQRILGSYQQLLGRYTPDGLLDTTFGNNGLVLTSLGANHDSGLSCLVALPDGSILVIGWVDPTSYGVNTITAVARYLGS